MPGYDCGRILAYFFKLKKLGLTQNSEIEADLVFNESV